MRGLEIEGDQQKETGNRQKYTHTQIRDGTFIPPSPPRTTAQAFTEICSTTLRKQTLRRAVPVTQGQGGDAEEISETTAPPTTAPPSPPQRWVEGDIASYHCFNDINVTDKTHVKGQTQRRGVVEWWGRGHLKQAVTVTRFVLFELLFFQVAMPLNANQFHHRQHRDSKRVTLSWL